MRKAQDMVSPCDVREWIAGYDTLHIDLGTGDGTFALHMARSHPDMGVIGVDTCLDNLVKPARRGLPNLRFVTCDATAAPAWLHGVATSVSINFPFGSLLRALANGGEEAHQRLFAIAQPGARIEIRVNGSAAKELGVPLEAMRDQLRRATRAISSGSATVTVEPHVAFRRFPSAWAKRLAYGRPSEVVVATARVGL
jgi:trans-aconitate methyltransferase